MEYYILESGSKGNCALIKTNKSSIIIDCGGTKKYLLNAFKEIDFDYKDANALLITHKHIDHIKQIEMFSDLKIYTPCDLVKDNIIISPYQELIINDLKIIPIELSHDCDICLGYIFEDEKERLVYITDTGYISKYNELLIKDADYYIIESNYDYEMLIKSNRPYVLKKRIHSNNGHMNNIDTADILKRVIGNKSKEITLAHISMECNDYDLVEELIKKEINNKNILIRSAKQYEIISNKVQ